MKKMVFKLIRGEYSFLYILYRVLCRRDISRVYRIIYSFFNKPVHYNSCREITIENAYHTNQCVHPSTISRDGRIVLAITPYPFSDVRYENPCILESRNGVDFHQKISNPIFVPNGNAGSYYSDPHLSLLEDDYTLVFREYRKSAIKQSIFWVSHSKDLINWSDKEELFCSNKNCICPILFNESLYYVVCDNKASKLIRKQSKEVESIVIVENPYADKLLWHFDLFSFKGIKYGLFTYSTNGNGQGCELFLGKEVDYDCWKILYRIDMSKYVKEIKFPYKASFVTLNEKIYVYVSVYLKNNQWRTIVIQDYHFNRYDD